MKIRLLQWLLIILSIAFLLVLTVLLFTEKDGDVIFKAGVTEFGQGKLKPSQTSQSKEKALTQSAFIQRTSSYLPSQASLNNTNTSISEDESRKILLEYTNKLDATYLWGTYKPHLIHALTQRTTKPLTMGFMYVGVHDRSKLIHSYKNIKSSSASYFSEYLYHNGKTFCESVFTDKTGGVGLNNYFFKEEMSDSRQRWHSVTVKDKNSHATPATKATFIYYFIIEDFNGEEDDRYLSYDADQGVILVRRPGLQDISESFKIVVYNEAKAIPFQDVQKYVFTDNQYKKSDTWRVPDIIEANLNANPTEGFSTLSNNSNTQNDSTNIIAVQFVIDPSTTFAIDISYDTSRDPIAVDNDYEAVDHVTSYAETYFMPEYKTKFTRNVPLDNQKCAVSALSNLISGIGYYYGNVVVKGSNTVEPKLPLYTGTPSKTEFPRGFLWDEGFHGLVYCRWNMEICLDVLTHWMGTQLGNGWIPREQLRGSESINNGNPNYVAQVKDEANPPTLMFLISAIIEGKEKAQLSEGAIELFNALYPRLKKWYDWFFATQMSEKYEGLFAWRSDQANSGLVLGSGLDDYPRGLAGGGKKPLGHLDLQVWMIFMADNMEKVARFGGKKDDIGTLRSMRVKLREQLKLFYDPVEKIHKDLVEDSNGNKRFSPHFGYVNLFPLFFGLIQRDSEELDTLLNYIQNPMKLWSPYGLLSLAKDDNLYMRTHDSYWGGPIWININYLTLRGLKLYYYSNSRARKVYEDLRQNIINTVKGQKEEHGYFFEQYNQDTGAGQKNYPFTGWTSTVMLIIYEQY